MSISRRSPIIEELAEHLRSGPLDVTDLQRFGISRMGFNYLGLRFSVSWYPSGNVTDIILDGDRFFASTADGRYLCRVAIERAERLFSEKVAELERRRRSERTGA